MAKVTLVDGFDIVRGALVYRLYLRYQIRCISVYHPVHSSHMQQLLTKSYFPTISKIHRQKNRPFSQKYPIFLAYINFGCTFEDTDTADKQPSHLEATFARLCE